LCIDYFKDKDGNMPDNLNPGDLAVVIKGSGGANNVRLESVEVPNCGNCIGSIPENGVLEILPKPDGWAGAYPHNDGVHVWVYVRRRAMLPDGSFKVIEGWTAASKNHQDYLMRMGTAQACLDTMGTVFYTYLFVGVDAKVLPPEGLIIRKEADTHANRVGGLTQGTVVTITDGPVCAGKMVWWQVKLAGSSKPAGWVREGDGSEGFLGPLPLE
jgi:hypothetical protein